jgi:hypothetical protein
MVAIVSRLPLYLQGRWRKEAYHSRERHDRYPTFVKWLEQVTKETNDPVFGAKVGKPDGITGTGKSDIKVTGNAAPAKKNWARSLNVQASTASVKPDVNNAGRPSPKSPWKPDAPKCQVCEQGHKASDCGKLKGLVPKERL